MEEKKVTRAEIKALLEENQYYSRMAAQKAGYAGLLIMAVYIVLKATIKGKEDNLSKSILTITMLLLIIDDIENVIHEGKKLLYNDFEEKA